MQAMETVNADNTYDEMNKRDNIESDISTWETTTFEPWITEAHEQLNSTRANAKRVYIWEPKEQSATNKTVVTEQTNNNDTNEKPHRGGIFKKENIEQFGLPRPTTGPRRGGIYKTQKL